MDPKNGERAVSRVFKREDVYRRFDPRLIPDLIVTNRPGYRVSWQSSLGVPTGSVFEDNRDVWSGDHCSLDPEFVKGILFASKAFRADATPGIADVTASIRRSSAAANVRRRGGEVSLVRRLAAAFLFAAAASSRGPAVRHAGRTPIVPADLARLQSRIGYAQGASSPRARRRRRRSTRSSSASS